LENIFLSTNVSGVDSSPNLRALLEILLGWYDGSNRLWCGYFIVKSRIWNKINPVLWAKFSL